MAASIAANMYFVIESHRGGSHHASYIIEQSPLQYYDTSNARQNPHFHITDRQLDSYKFMLDSREFHSVYLKPGEDGDTTPAEMYDMDVKFYTILTKEHDYYTDELTVVNNICDKPILDDIASNIPFRDLAQQMFEQDYKSLSGDKSTRGNLRYDAGYSGVNQTDSTVQPGMFFPKTMKLDSKGLGKDKSLQHSLFKAGANLMKLSDTIQTGVQREILYQNKSRNRLFGKKWAEALDCQHLIQFARFDALSCFGTGETYDYSIKKTNWHVDKQNSDERGEGNTPTIVAIVPVHFCGRTVYNRIGLNLYKKSCCGDFYRRFNINRRIAADVVENVPARGDSSVDVETHLKFEVPESLGDTENYWVSPAGDDKDGHLSLYVNSINRTIDKMANGKGTRNRSILIESLYSIAFTPSALTWRRAHDNACSQLLGSHLSRESFLETFIACALEENVSVMSGAYPRCQPQMRGSMSKRNLYQSLSNLDDCLRMANATDDTKKVVKRMSKSPRNGGIHGVGPFYAQVLINISIKLGLVKRTSHVDSIIVSPSTNTFKVLRDEYGVKTTAHAAEIIPFLMHSTGWDAPICENRLCEVLRHKFGKDNVRDVFFRGDCLYKIENGHVWTVSPQGKHKMQCYGVGVWPTSCETQVDWWLQYFGREPHPYDSTTIMLSNSKMTRRNKRIRTRRR